MLIKGRALGTLVMVGSKETNGLLSMPTSIRRKTITMLFHTSLLLPVIHGARFPNPAVVRWSSFVRSMGTFFLHNNFNVHECGHDLGPRHQQSCRIQFEKKVLLLQYLGKALQGIIVARLWRDRYFAALLFFWVGSFLRLCFLIRPADFPTTRQTDTEHERTWDEVRERMCQELQPLYKDSLVVVVVKKVRRGEKKIKDLG